MTYSPSRQQYLDYEHRLHPRAGDMWEDHLVLAALVLDVTDQQVTICKDKKVVDWNRWIWDLNKVEVLTRLEFSQLFLYNYRAPGTWAHVIPESPTGLEYVQEWKELSEHSVRDNFR